MKLIELKILPVYFSAVSNGLKNFEVRKNDRNFEVGDMIRLYEYLPEEHRYTGRFFDVKITYILQNCEFVKDGYCIMSIVPY